MDMDEKVSLIMRLDTAINKLDGAYYLWARRHLLKENTLSVLYALDDGKPHTQAQIARDWLIPRSTVNTVVKELVALGYARLTKLNDKEKWVELTAEGEVYAKAALKELYDAEIAAIDKTIEVFSPAFVDALEKYTDTLCLGLNIKK